MENDSLMDNYIKGEIKRKSLVKNITKSLKELKQKKSPKEFAEIVLKIYEIANKEDDKC
jgi:hypothetical protein